MRPVSAVIPKALLPLVDAEGRCRCVLHLILAEAAEAGIEQAIVMVSPGQQRAVGDYLSAADDAGLPEVVFVEQESSRGLGHAVSCAQPVVAGETFMVLLGDHLRLPAAGAKPCTVQAVECFDGFRGHAVVGMQVVDVDQVDRVGVACGEPVAPGKVFRCRHIVEKPSAAVARESLQIPGLGEGAFLAHAGVYIFRPTIFTCLRELVDGADGEIGLTEAQALLLEKAPGESYLLRVDGQVLDVGYPAGYAAAAEAVRSHAP